MKTNHLSSLKLSTEKPVEYTYILKNGKFTYINQNILNLLEYNKQELIGQESIRIIHPEDRQEAKENAREMLQGLRKEPYLFRVITKSGTIKYLQESVELIESGKDHNIVVGNVFNIADFGKQALRSENILNFLPMATFAIDAKGKLIVWNQEMEELTGLKSQTMLGKDNYEYAVSFYGYRRPMMIDLILRPDKEIETKYQFHRTSKDVLIGEAEVEAIKNRKVFFWGKASPIYDENGKIAGAIESIRDITHYRVIDEALRKSEKNFRIALKNSPLIVFNQDQELNYTWTYNLEYVLPSFEILGKKDSELFSGTEADHLTAIKSKVLKTGTGTRAEACLTIHGKQHFFDLTIEPLLNRKGIIEGVTAAALDITERKTSEKIITQAEEKYRNIFENAIEGIYQSNFGKKFIILNQSMANIYGYRDAEEFNEKVEDISYQMYADPEDRVKLKKIVEQHGIATGFEAKCLRKDGSIVWVSTNIKAVRDNEGNLLYYEGFCENITARKEAEVKLNNTLNTLEKALNGIVQTLSLTTEVRDPYTSGHQRRVTNLAHTIAKELNLPGETIEGIRMAGIIHDIGKISIPAEILSKPGKLNKFEYDLIRAHSQTGYEILNNIDFPWPIALIVHQHHERWNGSGYPQGLKEKEILPEARIIAVADVIEAMTNHRPYRPALGLDEALNEIKQQKGILYDPEVVDACVKLFEEKGYCFRD